MKFTVASVEKNLSEIMDIYVLDWTKFIATDEKVVQ